MRFYESLVAMTVVVCSTTVFGQSPDATYESNTSGNSMYGVARPVRAAEMPSLVHGLITKVHVQEGDDVKAGQLLVSLDDRMPRAAVAVAQVAASRKAVLNQAKAQLKVAKARLGRMQEAFQAQASSSFELEASQAEFEKTKSVILAAEEEQAAAAATLELRKAELERYSIRAPFDGTVVQIHSRVGSTVDPSKVVIDVADLSELEAELFLSVEMYGKVKTASALQFEANAPVNQRLTGRVVSVSPVINAASKTFRTVVGFPNKDSLLPAGFSIVLDEDASKLSVTASAK